MSSLKVPESGLQLLGGHAPDIPPQAFSLSLSDSVIESLIRNVRDGGEINLRLGPTPVSLFHDC
jgi:RNA polymerase II elongation factor ELL